MLRCFEPVDHVIAQNIATAVEQETEKRPSASRFIIKSRHTPFGTETRANKTKTKSENAMLAGDDGEDELGEAREH